MKKCTHLFPRDEFMLRGLSECIKKDGHYDAHEGVMPNGTHIEWEYDLECNCGCMDSDTFEDVCIIWGEIKS